MRLFRRLWFALHHRRLDDELREEMRFHRHMKEAALERAGASREQAAAEARRALGNDLAARARARDVWIWPWLQDVVQDVRFGARLLVKDRRLALAAIAAVSLGLGAAATAFTFLRGAVLQDLPLDRAERLVFMRTVDARGRQLGTSYADARDWRAAARSLSHITTSLEIPINIVEDALPAQRFHGSFVSHDLLPMAGLTPVLGRGFVPEDDRAGAPRVAIIAYSVWQGRYGADPAVVGRTVRVNDVPSTIVGVMPPNVHFVAMTEVWVPIGQIAAASTNVDATRGSRPVLIMTIGRLADGATLAQARAEMDGITGRLARDHPATNEGVGVILEPLDGILRSGMRRPLLMLMGAVSIVLLIACVNVANLLLARAVHRGREMAIRAALGATRWRIVRQLCVESLLMAAAAGVLGYLLSLVGVRLFADQLLLQYGDGVPPYWLSFAVDGVVFAFLAAVALGSSVLFGLAPALHVARSGNEALKAWARGATGGARARRWVGPLMATQLALTLVLLAGTGLLFRSYLAVARAGQVIDPVDLLTMQVSLTAAKYPQPSDIKRFYRQLDERLAAVQEFSAVTVASDIPLRTGINATRELTVDGRSDIPPEQRPTVAYLYVGPRYFETLKLPLLRGRELTAEDGAPGREAVIVNQRFASMVFPGSDPLGQRIRMANPASPQAPQPWFTIVGIVPSVPQILIREEPEPLVYVPVDGEPAPHRFVSIIVRATGDRAATVARLRKEVGQVDAGLPGYAIRSMEDLLAMSQWQYRVFGSMFALLAGIALVLATVGLYAVTAHAVTQRTQEIGVRVALGAHAPQVIWLFLRGAMLQLAAGLTAGLAGAAAVGGMLQRSYADPFAQSFLVGTSPQDPLAFGVVSALLILVALAASVWPARRASQVDPVVALRHE
jgi:predicted permease